MAKASSKTAIIAALIGNSLIAITKFIAAYITRSSAMMSEGVHSVVDTGNAILLLYGLHAAKKPADEQFPFGHGKEIYFWSFVVSILIFAVGSGVSLYEGFHRWAHPQEMVKPIVNYIVLSFAILFEGISFFFAAREFNKARGDVPIFRAVRRGKDPSLFTVLFEDSAAMLGLVVALGGVAAAHITGDPKYDALGSIAIGLILGVTAIWLAVETKSLLIGEAAEPVVIQGVHEIIGDSPAVERVNEVLTLHMGPEFIVLNVSADFKDDINAGEIENVIAQLSRGIRKRFPRIQRIFVEPERPSSKI